jgi:hypothetical protein
VRRGALQHKRAETPIIKINCNRIMDPNTIYKAILDQLRPHLKGSKPPRRDAAKNTRDSRDENAAAQAELEELVVPKGKQLPPLAYVAY